MKIILTLLTYIILAAPFHSATVDQLDPWYRSYNETYFQNHLPQTVIISHTLQDDTRMAETTPLTNGWYLINFNRKYGYHLGEGTSITELRNLFHEMCHVQVFEENTPEFDDHGPRWQSCMHRLADQNAFKDVW